MGYFPVRYDSRVVIYEHKMFIRLATVIIVRLKMEGSLAKELCLVHTVTVARLSQRARLLQIIGKSSIFTATVDGRSRLAASLN